MQIHMYTPAVVLYLYANDKMDEGVLEMYQTVESKCVLPLTEIPNEFL